MRSHDATRWRSRCTSRRFHVSTQKRSNGHVTHCSSHLRVWCCCCWRLWGLCWMSEVSKTSMPWPKVNTWRVGHHLSYLYRIKNKVWIFQKKLGKGNPEKGRAGNDLFEFINFIILCFKTRDLDIEVKWIFSSLRKKSHFFQFHPKKKKTIAHRNFPLFSLVPASLILTTSHSGTWQLASAHLTVLHK